MKTLLTMGFVITVDDYDDLAEIVKGAENAMSDALRGVLAKNDATLQQLSEVFEFYGISASPLRDTLEDPA